jgi:hypothetical protein
MTIKELIDKLETYNQNMIVRITKECHEENEVFSTMDVKDVGIFSSPGEKILYITPKYERTL